MARNAICAMFALLVMSSVVYGQTPSTTAGSINGTVTDTTKAVLPGVTVTLSGASVMGTSGAHNPTHTVQALAWRTADHIVRNWKTLV